jgi:hypothetical protein
MELVSQLKGFSIIVFQKMEESVKSKKVLVNQAFFVDVNLCTLNFSNQMTSIYTIVVDGTKIKTFVNFSKVRVTAIEGKFEKLEILS